MTMKTSILSQRTASNTTPRSGGKIRPGIKVLGKDAKNNKQAVEIYNKGLAARRKFSVIEKQITDATSIKNPMYPKNAQYFTVTSDDFGMQETAQLFIELYGEVKGNDPEKRLYRFPVVFHSDELGDIYPNQFRRYGGEPGYRSQYGTENSQERFCMFLPPVTPEMAAEQKAKRIKRPPRRELQVRGICDPHICPEYLKGDCKFYGTLQFYVPGVPTSGLLNMETTSEYAAEAIFEQLQRVHATFGGIPKIHPTRPGQPIFFITKVEEDRTYFEDGIKKKGKQWVPRLESVIDLGGVLQNVEQVRIGNASPATAAWLTAPKGMPEAHLMALPSPQESQPASVQATQKPSGPVSQAVSRPASQPAPQSAPRPVQNNAPAQQRAASQSQPVQQAAQPSTASAVDVTKIDDHLSPIEKLLGSLGNTLDLAGVSDEVAGDYFDMKVGTAWEESETSVYQCITIVEDMLAKNLVDISSLMTIPVLCGEIDITGDEFKAFAISKFGKTFSRDATALKALVKLLGELLENGKFEAQVFIRAAIQNANAAAENVAVPA